MKENIIQFNEQVRFIELVSNKWDAFNFKNKTVLFIEPYGAVLSLLKRGLEKGYNIIILTANTDLRTVPKEIVSNVSLTVQIDTANDGDVLNLALQLREQIAIHAVIPGFEYFVPLAAKVSALLGVPGIDTDTVWYLRRKDLMRTALQAAHLLVPKHVLIRSISDINKAAQRITFPAVCKPIDAAGSVNVKKVNNESELIDAAMRILKGNDVLWGYQLSNALLVEEYIDGKEYSLEGVVQNGKVIHFSLTEKFVSDQTEFIEVGHIVNAPMDNELKNDIQQYVDDVIKTLQADNCPFHAEIRLNKDNQPVLMEIAARLAGDKIGDLINLSLNINYFDYVYATYLGESLPFEKMEDALQGYGFFIGRVLIRCGYCGG